jgi:hypothetical protein
MKKTTKTSALVASSAAVTESLNAMVAGGEDILAAKRAKKAAAEKARRAAKAAPVVDDSAKIDTIIEEQTARAAEDNYTVEELLSTIGDDSAPAVVEAPAAPAAKPAATDLSTATTATAAHSLAIRSALVSAWKESKSLADDEARITYVASVLAEVVEGFAVSARAGAIAKAIAKTEEPAAKEALARLAALYGASSSGKGKRAKGTSPVVKTRYSRADITHPKADRFVHVTLSPSITTFGDVWSVVEGFDAEGRETVTLTKTHKGPGHAVRT